MKVYHQSSFDRWPFEDKSIQAIVTSPPYYSLRKYDIPDIIIDGNPECKHEWQFKDRWLHRGNTKSTGVGAVQTCQITEDKVQDNFCNHCSAWKGQYGLEPTYQLYIEHTLLWAKEAWRVLRDDGLLFLNIGDSWAGSNQGRGTKVISDKQSSKTGTQWMCGETIRRGVDEGLNNKCKMLIPHRVAIGLIDQGWILRNDIIWSKPNAMPESVRDRFSKKFEYIFMLSKTGKYKFYLDEVREENSVVSIERVKHSWKSEHPSIGSIDVEAMGDRFCNPLGKNPGDIWTINTQPSPEKHYAMWPESLVERMILCSTKSGDAVLDPFAGSACTLRVADKLNRVAYGIDLGYQEIQERRLSNIQKVLC